jgi:IclR family KDG regulon transcriptional repressor
MVLQEHRAQVSDNTLTSVVPAVDRAIQILHAFDSAEEWLGVSDLSRRLDFPKSTVHDILNTLAFHGFLLRDEVTRRYRLGPALFRLGHLAGMQLNLADVARPFMHELAAKLAETVILGTSTDHHIQIVAVVEPELEMKISASVGRRLHHSAGAPGKIFHAARQPEALADLLARDPLQSFTPRSITDPARYTTMLAEVRRQGYAVDNEEYLPGVRAVAAPVWDWSSEIIATLYVVGFTSHLTDERLAELARQVVATADTLSKKLSGSCVSPWQYKQEKE